MSHGHSVERTGFILVEALIALVILGVVFLALEGSLTLVLRSLAESERRTVATRFAESQRERAFASGCVAGSGSDSVNGVAVVWTAAPAAYLVQVTQTVRYTQRSGTHVEQYTATGACR
jgi:Tfp pilus assembly protein PilV